jgi:ketosteroid isomerase-like protein
LLSTGTLAWEPFASGGSDRIGFTVGKATFAAKDPANSWRSSYVTIWRRQDDGAWKVWFDTGRPVHEK